MREWQKVTKRSLVRWATAAAALGGAGCGHGDRANVQEADSALTTSWTESGTETDRAAAFGAQFGRSVATNGTVAAP
jgi:hypothetical protein